MSLCTCDVLRGTWLSCRILFDINLPGVSQMLSVQRCGLLSTLRPVLGNDEPLIELLGNALTFEVLSAFSNVLPQVICGQPIGR